MSMEQLRSLCIRMKELQNQKEVTEEGLTLINKELNEIRINKIPSLMESMELKNCTMDGLGRVQLASDLYMSTKEGQKPKAMQWLRDCGYEGMITETYNASSLKALARRLLEADTEIPEDIFTISPFTRASIIKT